MKTRKLLAVLLAVVMVVGMLPAAAVTALGDYPNYTVLYLDKGAITIGDGTVSGFGADGNAVTTPNSNGYYITQTDPTTATANGITVSGGSHNIVLDGLNIVQDNTLQHENTISIDGGTQNITINNVTITGPKYSKSAIIGLSGDTKLNLTVQGVNTLKNTSNGSTICVPSGTELLFTEQSTGTLNALNKNEAGGQRNDAVIGSYTGTVSGKITIAGGTLYVEGNTGTANAAGIGGGSANAGGCGEIVISGGIVTVKVQNACAIGDGLTNLQKGSVEINGGTVFVQRAPTDANLNYPVIGQCKKDSGTTVKITGGSIHAETLDSNGATVATDNIKNLFPMCYLAKVQVKDASDAAVANAAVTGIKVNGEPYGSTDVYTDADGWLYLWLPTGETTVSFTCGETAYTAAGEVKNDNSTVLAAAAAGGGTTEPTYTTLYLDDGAITIDDADGNYYITQHDPATPTANGITVSAGNHSIVLDGLNIVQNDSSMTENTITFAGGTHDVIFKDITITAPKNDGFDTSWNSIPLAGIIALSNGAELKLTVQGTNTLTNTYTGPTIWVPTGTELEISGSGTLNAINNFEGDAENYIYNNAAVIGSSMNENAGTISIKGGTLNVEAKNTGGAGIGGGSMMGGGTIIIEGGIITVAVSGGAAIGEGMMDGIMGNEEGGTLTISGGTIYTKRTPTENDFITYSDVLNNPVIGTTVDSECGVDVTITGGSIHAETVNNGEIVTTKYIETLTRELYQAKVQVKDASDAAVANAAVTGIKVSGADYGSTDVYTDAEGWLYLWLPAGDTTVTFTCGGQDYSVSGTVATDNKTVLCDDSGSGGGDPQPPENLKETAKTAAIAAFTDIPAYDGANQTAIAAKLPAADAAFGAAVDAGWSFLEIQEWEGYRRYADGNATQDISFPTVTLTVMGKPEEDGETAHYFIAPTNYSVPAGSSVAEVVTQALAKAGVDCQYNGSFNQQDDFFIYSLGGQSNEGRIGWMYMVNNNTYTSKAMNNYPADDGSNILVFYSYNGMGGPEFDQTNRDLTPYGTYATFTALKQAAGTGVTALNAASVMDKDWELISTDIEAVRVYSGPVPAVTVGANGSCLVWQSGNETVLGADGRILEAPAVETQVMLTATQTYGGETAQREITVTVGKAGGTGVTFTVSGAAATDNVSATATLSGLTGAEKYAVLEDFAYGKNVAAMDALYAYLTQANNTTALTVENGAIGTLFGLGYNATTGREWMVQVRHGEEIISLSDRTDNLLVPLADGDTVEYRYVAGTAALKTLYDSVAKENGATYSAASYQTFDEARTAAKALLEAPFAATQAQVDSALDALQDAYDGLVFTLDYFAGEENSAHQKVLNWLAANPLSFSDGAGQGWDGWATSYSSAPALVVLARNGMLTDSLIDKITHYDEVSKKNGVVVSANLQTTEPTYTQVQTMNALTMRGDDMLYYATDSREIFYAMDLLMRGSAGDGYDNSRSAAYRIMALNGPVYYPEYQNRAGAEGTVYVYSNGWDREEMSTGLTREYLLGELLSKQHNDGGWTANNSDALTATSNATVTAYVLMALAPYYYEDISLPATVNLSALKTACDNALVYMQSASVKAAAFNTANWVDFNNNNQVCLNALMFYGVDPESIKNDSGDGMITHTLKNYLSADLTYFEVIVPPYGNKSALFTPRFAEMMEYYKQFKANGRASLYGEGTYQNQAAKVGLEQTYFEARFVTLGLDNGWDELGHQITVYTKQYDYTEETVTPLLNAVDAAYSVLVRLDSTAAEIAAAKKAIEDATANLIPNTPAGAVIQQIKALTDITPDSPKADKVAAARTAYNALTDEQKAEVTNYADLVEAEHWSAIAAGYKNTVGIGNYLKKIGDAYAALGTGTTDDWKVVDMAIAGRLDDMLADDTAVQTFVTASIGRILPSTMTDYARVLLAVTALGVDGADLAKYCGFQDYKGNSVTSLVDALTGFDGSIVVNSMSWGLIALDSGDYEVPAGAKWTREKMIEQLLSWQLDSGAWPMNPGETGGNIDTTAMVIVALAPYTVHANVKAAADKALAYLAGLQTGSGSGAFAMSDGGGTGMAIETKNANSTAMVVLARIAAGEDPNAAYANGGKPAGALLAQFGLSDYSGFGYTDRSAFNDMATEQSFRALAAYHALAYDHSTAIYHFGAPTRTGPWSESGSGTTPTPTPTPTPTGDTITVTFRLIGAEQATQGVDLGTTAYLPDYVTWIATTPYTMDRNATVYDLWTAATSDAGIRSLGAESNYVKSVTAPDGYDLDQFTNGPRSGWMYTVNGGHPGYGLKEQPLHDGDTVIWHYVSDYAYEVRDWDNLGGDSWPAHGDGTYYSRWLMAADSFGAKGGGVPLGGGTTGGTGDKTGTGGTADTTPSETTTDENTVIADDGSKVTTETEKSVETGKDENGNDVEKTTETTKTTVVAPDGSTTATETVSETETTTGTTENADGSVTDTVAAKESVKETTTDADGKQTVTETAKERSVETTTNSETNADGSVTETAVTETKETVKETVTDAAGKVTETTTETLGTKNVETTVDADGKTAGNGTVISTTTVKDEEGKTLSTAVTEGEITVSTDAAGTVSEVTTAKTTTTDAVTGAVTEQVTVTTEAETTDGTTAKVVEDGEGNTLSAEATISEEALQAARESGEAIWIPADINPDSAATMSFNMPELDDGETFEAEFGITRTSPTIVAFRKIGPNLFKIIPACRRGSLIVPVSGDCEIVIMDNAKEFTDLVEGAWYDDSVKFVTAREIFNGYGDGIFAPSATMNRAMAAQIIYNFDGATAAGTGAFSDVAADAWYAKAVGWAAAQGIINGYNGAYSPLGDITRQDLVKILYYYAKQVGYDVEGVGDDVDLLAYADGAEVSDYAAAPMRWAISVGIVNGYADNTLRPRNTATRAEVAALMQRFVEKAVR